MQWQYDPGETLIHVMDIISDGVWDWNILTGEVQRNRAWYQMLGYDVDCFNKDVLTWENVIHPDDYPKVMAHFEDYVHHRIPAYSIQYRCIKADGSALWVEDSGRIVAHTEDGTPARMIGAHTDINALKEAQEQLQQHSRLLQGGQQSLEQIINERTCELALLNQQLAEKVAEIEYIASRDMLTGTYNRRMFEQLLEIEIKRAKRYSQPMSVILADIDLFKEVNDRYGHKIGDTVLSDVASSLIQHIRESDVIARWGGEEFAIILPNTATHKALDMAERLRYRISELISAEGIQVTCSFGVTELHPGDNGDSIFSRMDQALYQAKANHRNNVQLMPSNDAAANKES